MPSILSIMHRLRPGNYELPEICLLLFPAKRQRGKKEQGNQNEIQMFQKSLPMGKLFVCVVKYFRTDS